MIWRTHQQVESFHLVQRFTDVTARQGIQALCITMANLFSGEVWIRETGRTRTDRDTTTIPHVRLGAGACYTPQGRGAASDYLV